MRQSCSLKYDVAIWVWLSRYTAYASEAQQTLSIDLTTSQPHKERVLQCKDSKKSIKWTTGSGYFIQMKVKFNSINIMQYV
jgi:hypothetical protein